MSIETNYPTIFHSYLQLLRQDGRLIETFEIPSLAAKYLLAKKDGHQPQLINIPDVTRLPTMSHGSDSI